MPSIVAMTIMIALLERLTELTSAIAPVQAITPMVYIKERSEFLNLTKTM